MPNKTYCVGSATAASKTIVAPLPPMSIHQSARVHKQRLLNISTPGRQAIAYTHTLIAFLSREIGKCNTEAEKCNNASNARQCDANLFQNGSNKKEQKVFHFSDGEGNRKVFHSVKVAILCRHLQQMWYFHPPLTKN